MRYLAGISVFLFCFGYWICGLFFNPGTVSWWDLRIVIYTILICNIFFVGWKLTSGFTKAIFLTGIVFCAGDIVDRYLFNINEFHMNDILLYLFALIYLPKAYARETKTNT